jgi:endonuclease/exonuclease/phosphatase family metal-dependent hydrolase
MRLVIYNMRYATGSAWHFHVPFPFSGYLRDTRGNLGQIIGFLKGLQPDILGLIEVDNGSYRAGKCSQAEVIGAGLGSSHVYRSKYAATSVAQRLPIMRDQGNAFITNQQIQAQAFHYFKHGVKRLVIELEFETFVVFLVHLSLKFRHRQYQLTDLYNLFAQVRKPMIVAGDFNALRGTRELELFQAATGLRNANTGGMPTFPSRNPRFQLDFVLHSPGIKMHDFQIVAVSYSDHRPLVFDFEVAQEP